MHHQPIRYLRLAIITGVAGSLSVTPSAPAQTITAPISPAGRSVSEDVSLPIDAVFRDLRAAYAKEATADKIAVTIRERDRMPQMAVLILRVGSVILREAVKPPTAAHGETSTPRSEPEPAASKPAVEPTMSERRVRVVSIDAGDLRLHVQDRQLIAVLASNPTTYFAADLEEGAITPQLTKLIGPMPLLPLMLAEWLDGEALPVIAPQVAGPGSSWFKATTRLEPAGSPIVLLGNTPFGPMSMQVDGKAFRPMQALAAVSPAPRSTTMELELTPREPGDPAKWVIPVGERARVQAVNQLAKRIEPIKTPAEPGGAPASSPDVRPAATPGHP